jgi:pimeloyl-ACP methyl ester carboxylesterase
MPLIASTDGTRLYYEEAGAGSPVVFVHEFAGDYRTWEPQMRYFARSHRCVTFSARGYPPSDVPSDPARYGQDIARGDVIAVMDALGIDKAHVVGHSMGAATALHVGIRYPERCLSVTAAGCGYGSSADPAKVEEARAASRETGKMFATETMAVAAARYGDGPTRQAQKNKDPRGYAEFIKLLSEHSSNSHSLVMLNLQAKRPSLWEMEADLKKFTPPLLVLVGDEDEWCVDGSIYLKRTVPTAGLCVIPRSGHTITSEEPAEFNAAVAELIAAAEAGRWLAHKPN